MMTATHNETTKPRTKAQQKADDRAEACAKLRELLQPGDTVYTILRRVSRSGMMRHISCVIVDGRYGGMNDITWLVARACGDTMDRDTGGIKVGGCGMDMGFHIVYRLGRKLWPDGTDKPHGTRNGQPDTDGGYALKHRWL